MFAKNLAIEARCNETFEYEGTTYEDGKTYYIISEYSKKDPSDITKTTEWVLSMAKEDKLIIKNPIKFLPESNMVASEFYPYMENFTNYCRELL